MKKHLKVTVDGQSFDVVVEMMDQGSSSAPTNPAPAAAAAAAAPVASAPPPQAAPKAAPVAGDGMVASPLAATVISVDVKEGDQVTEGQKLITLEAMKMNTFINAPSAGVVKTIAVKAGDAVEEGQGLIQLS